MLNPKKLLAWTLLGLAVAQSTVVQGTDSRFARLVRRSHEHQQHHKRVAATTAATALAAGTFGAPIVTERVDIPEADKMPHAWEKKDVDTSVAYAAVARHNHGPTFPPSHDPGHSNNGPHVLSSPQDRDETQNLARRPPSHAQRPPTNPGHDKRIQGGGEITIGHDPTSVTTRYVAVERRTQAGGGIVIGHNPTNDGSQKRTQAGGGIVIGHDPTSVKTRYVAVERRTQGGGEIVIGHDPTDARGKKRTQAGGGAVIGPDPDHWRGGQKRDSAGEWATVGPDHGGKKRDSAGTWAIVGPEPGHHGGKKRTQAGGGAVIGPDPGSGGGRKRTQGGDENIIIGPPRSVIEGRIQGGGGAVIGPAPGGGGGKRATTPFDGYDGYEAKRTQAGGGAVIGPDPGHGGRKRTQGTSVSLIGPPVIDHRTQGGDENIIIGPPRSLVDARTQAGGGAVIGPDPGHGGGKKRTQGGDENIIIGPPRSLDEDVDDGSHRHLISRGMLPLGDGSYFAKQGRVTWYDGHMMDDPACGGKRPSENDFVVAVPKMLQSKCGYTIEIHHNHKTVKAKVVDYCADCENHHLDVSPKVFKALAPLDVGDLKGVHYRVLAKGMH